MSGDETSVDGATAAVTAAAAAPLDTSAPLPTATAAAATGRPALVLAPFAAASAKEAELYYHCDEWFLRADTRAAVQKIFRREASAQLSEGAVDLLLCFLQRLTRWVLIRTRTFSLDQLKSADRYSGWGSHSEFGGEDGETVVRDGRRAHVEWWLKRLCHGWRFAELTQHARESMEPLSCNDFESYVNPAYCTTTWPWLPGSAAKEDRPRSVYLRGDRLPAESQLFLGCALDFVAEIVASRTETALKSVNIHGHTHGRHYATDQHPHEWSDAGGQFECAICQSYGTANVYRCPSDTCDFSIHARCFIPRADGGSQSDDGCSSGNGSASAVEGQPERKRQRVDEAGASVGTAVASASSSSAAAAVAESSSVAAALPVWGVADLSAGLSEEGVQLLSSRLGVLRDLDAHATRDGELDADPQQWVWPTEAPCQRLLPQALEAPFEGTTTEQPLLSSTLANIRDLLQRYAWFHDPAQIAEVKRRFLSGALVCGHPLWQRRRRIRPVAFYGRSWKPRWTMPDVCIAAKVAYHDQILEQQQAADEDEDEKEEGEEGDPSSVTSSLGEESDAFDTMAFDLIDGAGREWPLLLEYRRCTPSVRCTPQLDDCLDHDAEAFNAWGSLVDRRTFRTLGLIRSGQKNDDVLTLQPVDAVPFFRHWALLSAEALAEATGGEGGDLDPEGTLRPHACGSKNGEKVWPDQWLALLHPALSQQQSASTSASAAGSASAAAAAAFSSSAFDTSPDNSTGGAASSSSATQSDSDDSTGADSIAAIRLHAAQVHTQIQRLVCAAATLTEWKAKELSMFRAFHPPRVVREFTTAALLQRMGADDCQVAAAADRAAAAANDVSGSSSCASAASPSVSHPFAQLPRDLWSIVAEFEFAPLDLPFVALDPSRPVGAGPPAAAPNPAPTAAAAAAGSDKDDDDDDAAAGEFVGADGRPHDFVRQRELNSASYSGVSSLHW